MGRYEQMKKIKEEVVGCRKCSLYKNRNLPVVGEGNHEAEIMFVGEGPGANEDRTGRPFCGRAGDVLDQLLNSIDLPREQVYISNIVKCRPPGNRDPRKKEVEACTSYLEKQMEVVSPEVICPLGRHAMYFLMKKYGVEDKIRGISKIHGREFKAETPWGEVKIIPFYHPAVVAYRATMKPTLKKDFQILKKYI